MSKRHLLFTPLSKSSRLHLVKSTRCCDKQNISISSSKVSTNEDLVCTQRAKFISGIYKLSLNQCTSFLATLVALHFTPVSESLSQWAEFRTSVAPRLASLLSEKGNWNTWILCLYISCFSVQTLNWIESPITYPSRPWGMKKITLKIKVLVHQNEATSFACHRASVDFVYFSFFYAVTDCSFFQETFQFWFWCSGSLFSLVFH